MKYFNLLTISLGISGLISFSAVAQKTEVRFTEPVKLPASINSSEHEESYPLLSPDEKTFYFVRTFTSDEGTNKKGDQDIFVSKWENNNWSVATNELPTLNNKFTNAVVGVSKDGERIYVLNQYPFDATQTAKGISLSKKEADGIWAKPKTVVMPAIPFEGDHYGAFVSRDERVVIFSANLKGQGEGKEDLYVALQNADGRWKKVQHMGTTINTEEADFAPFMSHDNKRLYFSSYGHKGMGSSDIYVSERLDDSYTKWSEPKNLGKPINSKGFDGYFAINDKDEILFSSNRGKGFSDIYSTKREVITIEEPKEEEPTAEDAIEELKKKLDLKLIYFETDKAKVKEQDAIVLNAVYDLMKQYDEVEVIIKGHTDNIASESYNMKLSERRANAAAEYLVKKGLNRERIKVEFYGESRPAESNETAKGRKMNRRVELALGIRDLK